MAGHPTHDENGVYIGDIQTDRTKKPIYGMFPDEDKAAAEGKCISCNKIFSVVERAQWSIAGQREWYISSMCEPCFDSTYEEDDGNGDSQQWLDEEHEFEGWTFGAVLKHKKKD